jgi:hypothetical protein
MQVLSKNCLYSKSLFSFLFQVVVEKTAYQKMYFRPLNCFIILVARGWSINNVQKKVEVFLVFDFHLKTFCVCHFNWLLIHWRLLTNFSLFKAICKIC